MPWYRTVIPQRELTTLKDRGEGKPTFPSAFHYLRTGVAQSLFAAPKTEIGITLKRDKDRVVLWRKGGYCGVSDAIFKRNYTSREAFEKAARDNNYVMITEEEVKRDLEDRFAKNIDEARREMIPKEDRKDYAKLAWSEAVFKYQFGDIDEIVVNPLNIDSCCSGYAFSKTLEKLLGRKINFAGLQEDGEGVVPVDRESLKKAVLGEDNLAKTRAFMEKYESILDGKPVAPTAAAGKPHGRAAFGDKGRGGGAGKK